MSEGDPPPRAEPSDPGGEAPEEGVETYVRGQRGEGGAPSSLAKTLLAQLLPPLLLAPLVVIPLDLATILLWVIAALCLLVSMISAVVRLLTIGFGATSQRRERLLGLIRPLLTTVIVCSAHVCVQHSIYLAQHEVARIATTLQSEGRSAGIYPEVLPGWREGTRLERKCSRLNFGWTANYVATYSATEPRDGFTLSLRLDTDTSLVLMGGKETELSASLASRSGSQELSLEELLDR